MGKKANTRGQAARARPVQSAQRRQDERRVPGWAYVLVAVLLAGLIAGGSVLLGKNRAERTGEAPSASIGLPNTADYHSLLVAPNDPARILLGTHAGLYESQDGGHTWNKVALTGQDAMNLARGDGETLWTAGHNVFAKSADGGTTWNDVRPQGLPTLDIHGFAVDPMKPQRLYAAVAGNGLFRSGDGGRSFTRISADVGGAVMALAITPDGRILAGDMEQGLLAGSDGGSGWEPVLKAPVMGLAVNPADPKTIVAGGPGILLSTDGGATWRQVLALEQGAGPVAWSQSDADVGYAVGFDRTLYRTNDRGRTWRPAS